MTWSVDLKGDRLDLDGWVKWLDGQFTASVCNGAYRLTSTLFEGVSDPVEVQCKARELIEIGNGLGRLLSPEYHPVALGNVRFTTEDGSERVFPTGRSDGRSRDTASPNAVLSDGTRKPDPSVGAITRLLPLISESEPVRRALLFVGREELGWNDLYRAWEVVREAVGNERFTRKWITKRADNLFTRTANSYTALGINARHGDKPHDPPPNPMKFSEAKVLILKLVYQWVEHEGSEQEVTAQYDLQGGNGA